MKKYSINSVYSYQFSYYVITNNIVSKQYVSIVACFAKKKNEFYLKPLLYWLTQYIKCNHIGILYSI